MMSETCQGWGKVPTVKERLRHLSHTSSTPSRQNKSVYKTNHGERNRTWEPSWAKDVAQQVDHALTAQALNLGKRWWSQHSEDLAEESDIQGHSQLPVEFKTLSRTKQNKQTNLLVISRRRKQTKKKELPKLNQRPLASTISKDETQEKGTAEPSGSPLCWTMMTKPSKWPYLRNLATQSRQQPFSQADDQWWFLAGQLVTTLLLSQTHTK